MTSEKQTAKFHDVVTEAQRTIEKFVTFPDKSMGFVAALYAVFSHFWTHFDSLPYLVITAFMKRSGKTTLLECIQHIGSNPLPVTGITPSTLFRMIQEQHPLLCVDEAESLSREGSDLREPLNAGYRRGQTVPRTVGGEVKQFDLYCPKVFCLIGDVNDTLRDRSVVLSMVRADSPKRSSYTERQTVCTAIREKIAAVIEESGSELIQTVLDTMTNWEGAAFLSDREEEIWLPLFIMCRVFCPLRYEELKRVATDLSYNKSAEARTFQAEFFKKAEAEADAKYFGEILIHNIHTVIGKRNGVPSAELLSALKQLVTSPWRTYKGRGLTYDDIGSLLGVVIERNPNGAATAASQTFRLAGKVVRGYSKKYIQEAANRAGIKL